jgi:two-component system chemotaxis response regulator CheV
MGPKKSEIMLESGTNELGLLEFRIGGNSFGINVPKCASFFNTGLFSPCPMPSPMWRVLSAQGTNC